MAFDYEKEGLEFKKELEEGKFHIEILENEGANREKKEASDVAAFESYLESEDFKFFRDEVLKK